MTTKSNLCPICKKELWGYKGMQKHIVQKARYESWRYMIDNEHTKEHFDYYLKNTKPSKITTRTWVKI